MKLTVSLRIIGGFTFVTLLLLILGGLSLSSINTVEEHTNTFKRFAVPAKDKVNQLSLSLNRQFITIQSAHDAEGSGELDRLQQRLQAQQSQLSNEIASLNSLLQTHPEFALDAGQASAYNDAFQQAWSQLLQSKLALGQGRTKLKTQVETLEIAGDDASSILLDLMDLEVSDNPTERQMAGEANNMDSAVASMVAIGLELGKMATQDNLDTLRGETEFLLRSLDYRLEGMVADGEATGQQALVQELTDNLNTMTTFLRGDGNLIDLQQANLRQAQAVDARLDDARSQYDALIALTQTLQQQLATISDDAGNLAMASLESTRSLTMAVMLGSILVATLISLRTRQSITKPLGHINEVLAVLASGDLTKRLSLTNHDEFGKLAGNINALSDALRELIQSITERADQLAAAAEETSAVTAQTTSGIQEQTSQIEQVASATNQLSSSANQVATNANDALGETQQADEETRQARALSENNGAIIQNLADEVERTAQVINKLNNDTAAIGSILDVIRGIAEQTNLLALNAAIEAARAGEQGRGFAVVADEVRSLASRTQESTTEIQQMIEVVQDGARQAEEVMQKSQDQARRSVTTTEEANAALEAITRSVAGVVNAGNQISQAAAEQNTVSQTISEKLEQIATISEQTSSGAIQTATSSQQVAQLAEELQQQVRRFKVV
ncbi:methyl-accepting chemotaxis protein [Ferrimonas sediminicola]|uniref:Methyl-accepting chemotaxis protein n=1 Tax=Ferrimonas sediminicola TaxID=2569538 RepID=A0A4U1BBT6_9GAMM|nr:methyl-accepting chemotaxis protein [Ferrimonas sediminicola]TKB48070.1 methyl-accepting chemotaxis protein [Ferrimonas sediminicola]